jgi:UTP--glucose-1-phosphate uridylyltransferase
MEVKTAVIAAAGFGSRFLPVVKNIPKEMLPIIDKPSIQYLVEECFDAGIEKIIIVVRKGNTLIKDYFSKPAGDVKELLEMQGKMDRFSSIEKVLSMKDRITVIDQDPSLPYGNGSPFYTAKDLLDPNEAYVFIYGDDMVIPNNGKGGVRQVIDFYKQNENIVDIVQAGDTVARKEVSRYGTVKFRDYDEESKSGTMEYQIEKPTNEEFEQHKLSLVTTYGRIVTTYKIFKYLTPSATGKDGELWIPDAIAEVARNGNVKVKILDGKWVTTGDPERFLQAMIYFYLRHPKYGQLTKDFIKSLVQ